MKASTVFKGSLLALSLLLAAGAFAVNKGSLELNNPVSVGGKQLAPGTYTLQWDGNGPDVQLNILKGNKVIVTTPAHVTNADRASDHNEAVVNVNGDGTRSLAEIRLSGKKYVLDVGEAMGGSSSGNSSGMR